MIASRPDAGLLPGFDYTIIPSSSSVVDRKQGVPAFPTSASTLSPTGTRTARIRIGGDSFCDSSSVRLSFTIVNKENKSILPYTGPWGCFGTVRLLSNGTEIERVDMYGRHHELFGLQLLPLNDQWSEAAVCGLHGSWDNTTSVLQPKLGRIQAGASLTVMHKLHLGVFQSQKILPLRFCPLDLELTLAPPSWWIDTVSTGAGGLPTYSQDYEIANLRVIYDEVHPDESIVNSFYKGLLAGQIMSVPILVAHQFTTDIPDSASTIDITAARAFSKISSIWLSFSKNLDISQPKLTRSQTLLTSILADQSPCH